MISKGNEAERAQQLAARGARGARSAFAASSLAGAAGAGRAELWRAMRCDTRLAAMIGYITAHAPLFVMISVSSPTRMYVAKWMPLEPTGLSHLTSSFANASASFVCEMALPTPNAKQMVSMMGISMALVASRTEMQPVAVRMMALPMAVIQISYFRAAATEIMQLMVARLKKRWNLSSIGATAG